MNGDYSLAVHAMVYLDHRGCCVPSQALAVNICTNAARVRKVLRPLVAAGLVHTREGADGGYALARSAEGITLRDVAQAIGVVFVQAGWTPGSVDMDCLVASSMGRVMDGLYAELNDMCMSRLERATIRDVTKSIFDGRSFSGGKSGVGKPVVGGQAEPVL